ncbi:MAG: helix-turn-helix transcriptional regulator [Ruminococcaceae bacterium]|nr:helix-turn-helix transcriptional regulator [Oscillospiraceae bacterium]
MNAKLIVVVPVTRTKFVLENFIGSDDIFALVKSGSFYAEKDGESFTIQANEGMLFKKDTLYHRRVINPVEMFLFRYSGNEHLFDTDHVVFKDTDRILSTINLLDTFDSEIYENSFEYKHHLFEDIVLQYLAENKATHSPDALIEKAATKIRNNFHLKINLSEIAAENGLSYVQFSRRFKAATGLSPSDYITSLRIDKSKHLLANTKLKINEISSVCGFENEYYFSNFFKKHTKLSPSAFRSSLI